MKKIIAPKKEKKISTKSFDRIGKEKSLLSLIILVLIIFICGAIIGYITNVYILFSYPSPTKSNEDVIDNAIKDYITLYLGLINVSVGKKVFDANTGIWVANVSAISANGKKNLEVFIYDSNLSIQKISEVLLLPEKPATILEIPKKISCSFGNKTAIDIYIDPYDKWSRNYDDITEEFLKRFNKSISPIWRIVQTNSYRLKQENPNTIILLLYFECMKNKPIFSAFKDCIYQKYGTKKEVLSEDEIIECINKSNKNDTESEFVGDIDLSEIKNCTESIALRELAIDESFGNTYLETIATPMIVIDCKYKTWPTFIDKVMCYLYPSLEECKN